MRLVIGITGSTGVIYGIRMLEVLKELGIETNLIMSEWAQKCITMETEYDLNHVKSLATGISDDANMAANVSSGTHKTDGMIVIPCSMKTLSGIANGYDETLVARAAGVILKESRKLILVARETPLTAINLEEYADRLGMISTVIVGNSSTYNFNDLMINPRGYKSKYNLQAEQKIQN